MILGLEILSSHPRGVLTSTRCSSWSHVNGPSPGQAFPWTPGRVQIAICASQHAEGHGARSEINVAGCVAPTSTQQAGDGQVKPIVDEPSFSSPQLCSGRSLSRCPNNWQGSHVAFEGGGCIPHRHLGDRDLEAIVVKSHCSSSSTKIPLENTQQSNHGGAYLPWSSRPLDSSRDGPGGCCGGAVVVGPRGSIESRGKLLIARASSSSQADGGQDRHIC